MPSAAPHPLLSLGFARAYWVTARPYLFFISGVSGLVGLALGPALPWPTFALAFLPFFASYGFGQALTDVFQTDTDALSAPYRPLTQGLVTGRQVLGVSLGGLLLCALVYLWLNPWTLAFSLAGVVGLATYSKVKRTPLGGPPWNSAVVALLPVMGALCGGGTPGEVLRGRPLWLGMGSVFFGYAVFVLLGYFKDLSADRATGYRTLPVVVGWVPSVAVSALMAVGSGVCGGALLLALGGALVRPGPALWLLGQAAMALAHVSMLRTRDEHRAHPAIARVVHGYVLTHLGLAVAARGELWLPAVVYYAAFALTLARRPDPRQI